MASAATNDIDGSATQKSYPKDYRLSIRIVADPATYDPKKDWMLDIEFRCQDLLQVMREGLFWTTSNVVPERGCLAKTSGPMATHYRWRRLWDLCEFADRPESECCWVATATLYAHSVKTLADFRLHTLHRKGVTFAQANNKTGHSVFIYDRAGGDNNFNCFLDNLHPSHGSWWFWPMEAILDYDALGCGAKTETGSLD
jgi:hypothetical protein